MADRINFFTKETIISAGLIVLGFIFECLFFNTDIMILNVKFWILGVICITVGILGLWKYLLMPILELKAKNNNQVKK